MYEFLLRCVISNNLKKESLIFLHFQSRLATRHILLLKEETNFVFCIFFTYL